MTPSFHSPPTTAAPGRPRSPRQETDPDIAELIAHLVAFATGVSALEVASIRRNGVEAARARQVAMYLAHTGLSWPLGRVALAFGRDRSTVAHACAKVEDWRDDAVIDARLVELEACLQAAPRPRGLAPDVFGAAT